MKYLAAISVLAVLGGVAVLAPAGEDEMIWQNGKWVRQAPPAEGTAEGEAAIVRHDLDGKKYGDAIQHAERFLKRYPSDPLREQVLGLAGDAELGRGMYWQAYERYEKQLGEFPNGTDVERTLEREMEVAATFLAGKKRVVAKVFRLPAEDEGIEILHRVAEHAPGTATAELALLMVGDHFFKKANWQDAAGAYDSYLKLFPKSQRTVYAEVQAAHALRQAYRGAYWDDTSLIEAEQRYKMILRDYPAAAREANVGAILQDIQLARAQKQFEVGRFYLRTGKKEAAIRYFNRVVDEYGQTEWARKAEIELTKLGQARTERPERSELASQPAKPEEAKP